MFNLYDYHFELPKELIARYPLPERQASRLLCLDRSVQTIRHRFFYQLPDLLQPGDLLVMNNTRVIPARSFAMKTTGGRVEILVERQLVSNRVLAQLRASKTPKPGSQLIIDTNVRLTVGERQDDLFELVFPTDVLSVLQQYGHIPLPPYLERPAEAIDHSRYQTVYATRQGAVAAPTAGLHFDEVLLQRLQDKKIDMAYVTLHVGAGTFQPVRVQDIRQHVIHAECMEVSETVCQQVRAAKERKNRVIAVGTTSVRAIETAAQGNTLKPFTGDTRLFIYPGYQFRCVDAVITNFHLPESSLLMLVCAFGGYEAVMGAYQEAIRERYRFYSYGDSMFVR